MFQSPKPLWYPRLPIPIRSPHQWKLKQNKRALNRVIRFHRANVDYFIHFLFFNQQEKNNKPKTNIIHSDNFCCMSNWECKDKIWRCNSIPCPNVEPPLHIHCVTLTPAKNKWSEVFLEFVCAQNKLAHTPCIGHRCKNVFRLFYV